MKWRTGLLSRSGDSPREIKYGKESQLGQFIHPSPPLGSVTHILPLSIMLMPQNPPPPSISSQPPPLSQFLQQLSRYWAPFSCTPTPPRAELIKLCLTRGTWCHKIDQILDYPHWQPQISPVHGARLPSGEFTEPAYLDPRYTSIAVGPSDFPIKPPLDPSQLKTAPADPSFGNFTSAVGDYAQSSESPLPPFQIMDQHRA